MAYIKQNWIDGETVITAERLIHIEEGIENEQTGPKGDKGDTGEAGPQGPKGDTGEGLTGTAEEIVALDEAAELTAVVTKLNEVISKLKARGIIL